MSDNTEDQYTGDGDTAEGPGFHPVRVDYRRLVEEWQAYPEEYRAASRLVADAQADLADAKNDLDLVRAEVDREVRDAPDRFGLKKVTEGAVEGAVLTHARVRDAQRKLVDAQYAFSVLKGRLDAVAAKRPALENGVKMALAGWYAAPQVGDLADAEQARSLLGGAGKVNCDAGDGEGVQ